MPFKSINSTCPIYALSSLQPALTPSGQAISDDMSGGYFGRPPSVGQSLDNHIVGDDSTEDRDPRTRGSYEKCGTDSSISKSLILRNKQMNSLNAIQ